MSSFVAHQRGRNSLTCSIDSSQGAPMNQGQRSHPGAARAERTRFRLTGVTHPYDVRTSAVRPDLADLALAETHFAPHYAAAVPLACIVSGAALHADPDPATSATSELLFG